MNCSTCGAALKRRRSTVLFQSEICGKIAISNVFQLFCGACDEARYEPGEYDKILEEVRSREECAIRSRPIAEFVSVAQAIELLGVSKQAFSKNKRIQRGFVMSAEIDGRRYYLRDSVDLFKRSKQKTGLFLLDGREEKVVDAPDGEHIVSSDRCKILRFPEMKTSDNVSTYAGEAKCQ